MPIKLVDVLRGCVGFRIQTYELGAHHKFVHERGPVLVQNLFPISLSDYQSGLRCLGVALEFAKRWHVAGCRSIKRGYVKVAH